jgi:hypothetical protein
MWGYLPLATRRSLGLGSGLKGMKSRLPTVIGNWPISELADDPRTDGMDVDNELSRVCISNAGMLRIFKGS